MPKGFFAKSQLLALGSKPIVAHSVARCELCNLYKGCISPKMPVTGKGRLGVLIIAEAPGKTEDERNVQLIGEAGQKLRTILKSINVDLDEDCWKTNALICRPVNNRTPTTLELEYCRPNYVETIKQLQPTAVIALGKPSLQQVIGPYWTKDLDELGRWCGTRIPLQATNTWICPTWHPSYLNRINNPVVELWFKRHLEAAFGLSGRPWNSVPDYKSSVEIIDYARPVFQQMANYEGMAAVDFETNMLKPDHPNSVLVSCSITWGRGKYGRCIAYPMTAENRHVTIDFLRSPIPKIGANQKFELRWAMRQLGTRIRNLFHDTMQSAHVQNNMEKTTSNDFQSFILLGFPNYSEHISPLLKSKGSAMTVNQILNEINIRQLLMYNGLDTVTEFEIAVRQMKQLGKRPPWGVK